MTRAVVVLCLLACGGSRGATTEQERVRLEEILRRSDDPSAVTTAARDYRELMAEHPDALRLVADAFARVRDRKAAVETLRTLIGRGQATREDRFRAIELVLWLVADERTTVDEPTYRTNLEWLQRELHGERDCRRWRTLVAWTDGHPEAVASIKAALAVCSNEGHRGELFGALARLTRDPNDACHAVVHGRSEDAKLCIEASTGWQ